MEEVENFEYAGESEFKSASYDFLLYWMRQRLNILNFPESSWDADQGNAVIVDFITGLGPKTMTVFRDGEVFRFICEDISKYVLDKNPIAYFLRSNPVHLSKENVSKEVQYGSVGGRGLTLVAFERMMKGLVEKHVAHNNELTGHYHTCMAALTDTLHCRDGRTVLYCPRFEYNSVSEASQDKERLQIMESIVIHWRGQIKKVVSSHDGSGSSESSGPLDEIEFWKVRAQDLLGIQKQLESENVRRIIDVLQYAKSNYINQFQTLTQQIVSRAAESNDNLKFLESIRPQCTALRTIEPNKVIEILPDLLNRIRLIWSHSKFYNDDEHISGILRKISNEIIRRFRGYIDVTEVWNGDVEHAVTMLNEAIHCGGAWKDAYHKTCQAIQRQKARYGRVWEIDDASIFAQIDAFVQRCRDLIEICESQMQFVRKTTATQGLPGPIPHFGGTRAQEIIDGILGIQDTFEHHVDRLRKLEYDVLDVKISNWHDDYNHFKSDVKDLEVMYNLIINAAFENNSTVCDGVTLVETFYRQAKRYTIIQFVKRKATDTNNMFCRQVKDIREEFEKSRTNPPLRMQEPQYAGSALWAHSLSALVKESYECLKRLQYVLMERDFEESREAMISLTSVVQDFKLARYNSWLEDLHAKAANNGLQLRLEKTLIRKSDGDSANAKVGSEIVCNFDEDLISLFAEVSYWEKFQGEFNIPYQAHDMCNKKEQLRVMRENVMLVVRAYNELIRDVNAEEKRLFLDHIRKLDRRIAPGLTKLNWLNRTIIENYVRDCCTNCHDVHSTVKEFKDCKHQLNRIQKQISTALLLRIDKNQIYENSVFEHRQSEHRAQMHFFLEQSYNKIVSALRNIYKNFKDGSSEVQREWRSQIAQVHKFIILFLFFINF